MLTPETKELICDHFAGGCTGILGDFFHWDTGKFLATHDEVAEVLEEAEIVECEGCGWWSHPGENYLGHEEGCECHAGICGECCPRND